MTQENASGQAVAERVRAADIAVGGNSSVEAMLANSLRERKPLADTGKLYDSIQAAENDASAFIFVPPGTFNESVTIDTAGLTLLGSGRATLVDGGTTGSAIEITSTNVTVENLSVKTTPGGGNAYSGVISNSSSNNLKLYNIIVRDSDDQGFIIIGPDSEVISCNIESTDDNGVLINGARSKMIGNIVTDGTTGLYCNGDDQIIANNQVRNTGTGNIDDAGIRVRGNDSVCIANRIHNAGNHGIHTQSTDSIIANNRISNSGGSDIQNDGTGTTLDANLTGAAN